jgi:hypothetical protein
MSRLYCPGCGHERRIDVVCPTCKKAYCGENCLRPHLWRHHFNGIILAAAICATTLALLVAAYLLS